MQEITKRLDGTGRILIPLEFREELQMENDEEIRLRLTPGGLFIKCETPKCVFCGATTTGEYRGKPVCLHCVVGAYTERIK